MKKKVSKNVYIFNYFGFRIELTKTGFAVLYDCSDEESEYIKSNVEIHKQLEERLMTISKIFTEQLIKNESIIQ